jgi:hypothetical protein
MGSVETQIYTRTQRAMAMGSPETPGRANDNLLLKQFFSQL